MVSTTVTAGITGQLHAQAMLSEIGGPPEWTRRRELTGDSRPQTAKKLGIHRQTIYDWEKGNTSPSGPVAVRYLGYLLTAGEDPR
jgi:DNA-binding XRE family transcriptional regulator